MLKKSRLSQAIMLAFGGGLLAGAIPAMAQDTQRVEITGSSIRRIDAETALPVQVIKREEIARSGATNTTDLLQRLPAIQGSFGESSSVGGGSGGFAGVSVHNLTESRTLVLLNGHRLAQFGGQTLTGFAAAVDLNSIPISAIDRVEILTDGASALYGSDAIAGVVNFITRRDTTEGDVSVGYSSPSGGARETRISASKGFGSLEKDGFNVLISASHDERTKLDATARDFGQTGRVFFDYGGLKYRKQQFSASPIPANVLADPRNPARPDDQELVSPFLLANKTCPPKTFRVTEPYASPEGFPYVDDYCGFDFVGELEIYPIRKRDTLMASSTLRLGEHDLYADVLWGKSTQVSRIAPVPGSISIPTTSPLFAKYLAPVGITQDTLAFYRLYDLGKRENNDKAEFLDLALGSKGMLLGWDYNASLNYSKSDSKSGIAGYPGALGVKALTNSGLLDPFVGPGLQSAAAQAAINAAGYKGYWDGGVSTLTSLNLRASREIGNLPGGPMQLGLGANYQRERFQSKPSLFAQGKLADPVAGTLCDPANGIACDQRFGDEASTVPYSANRKAYGLFGELVMPVLKELEFTASLRYDHYNDFGSASTGKASLRWTPSKQWLVRASVGTGFHAPTVPQVNAVLQPFGVTSEKYLCTADLKTVATSLNAQCQPGNKQYDQIAGGNRSLKPEKSHQATLGIRFEPTSELSMGADLWHVNIRDIFGQLTEDVVFASPTKFLTSWGTKKDTGTGVTYLAFVADNKNLGKQYSTGLDLDVAGRFRFSDSELGSQLKMTYMIREKQQLLPDGPYYSAIGNFAELGQVTFRWQGVWTNTLKMGQWAHTLAVNFKSGYTDKATSAERLDAAGNVVAVDTLRVEVPAYFTMDWQTSYAPTKNLLLTLGVLNLANETPPLAISTGGLNRGQQFGFDDRYYDSRGRTFYLNASYKF